MPETTLVLDSSLPSDTECKVISGHRTEKGFLNYIKIDEEKVAKKMMEYW